VSTVELNPATTTASRPSRDHYDVIVVGARVAGAATAHVLARLGLDVLLVDRSRYGADTLSTHALMRAGVIQLSRWGLLDQIIAAGTPPVRRTTFRYGGEVIPVDVRPGAGVDALYAPRRTVLDPILVDAAVAAGAEACFGITVTDLARGRHDEVTGITAHAGTGDPFVVSARLVIGADGIRSTVAGLVRAREERAGTGRCSVTYGYFEGMELDGYEWNFRPGAASGVIPTNGGAANVFVLAPPDRVERGGDEVFHRLLADSEPELAARIAAAHAASPLRTFIGRPGHVRRSWGSGWALVGDAGYFKDPVSAHGITDALRDAELVARAAVEVVAGGAAEREALAAYQAQRDELSSDLFDLVDTIAAHRWTDDEIGALLRGLNVAMAAEVEVVAALPDLPMPSTAAA
jgi:2-polyprenyl-6-methoxyphenol hydroxylase-like FAD-dependent oxidoreductase